MCKTFNQWRSIHKQQLTKTDYTFLEQQKNEALNAIKNHQQLLQEQLILKQEMLTHKELIARITQEFNETKATQIQTKKIAVERLLIQKSHLEVALKDLEQASARINEKTVSTTRDLQQLQSHQIIRNDQSTSTR